MSDDTIERVRKLRKIVATLDPDIKIEDDPRTFSEAAVPCWRFRKNEKIADIQVLDVDFSHEVGLTEYLKGQIKKHFGQS